DVLDGGGTGFHGAGARAVADRAVAHHLADDLLAVPRPAPRTRGQPHVVAAKHLALVRVIDGRQLDVLPGDVVPHIGLGPVRQREYPHVLAGLVPAVVEVPQLGPLPARLPLAERVAQAENALLGASSFLVPAAATEDGVEAVLG